MIHRRLIAGPTFILGLVWLIGYGLQRATAELVVLGVPTRLQG